MKVKVILFGSTGMIGRGVLLECLDSDEVESVLVINRHSCNILNNKLKEIVHNNLFDLSALAVEMTGYDTCFFCLGVSSAGMKEPEYHKITYELTVNVANALLKRNKDLTFCYISGAKTDSTEKGKMMWARVKGKTENALLTMPFKKAYMFRPGFIQPMKGIKSRTKLYNILYAVFNPFYFILKHFKSIVTNTEILGKAMINTAIRGYGKNILESSDINKVANDQ